MRRARCEHLERAYTLAHDPEIAAHWGEALWKSGAAAGSAARVGRRARAQSGFGAAQSQRRASDRLRREAVMTGVLRARCAPYAARASRGDGAHDVACGMQNAASVRSRASRNPGKCAARRFRRATFDLNGRIAVAAAQEGFNARLRWQQKARARSSRSMGRSASVACASPPTAVAQRAELARRATRQRCGRDEIDSALGFEPPLSSLRYWVLGVPDPAHPADEDAR